MTKTPEEWARAKGLPFAAGCEAQGDALFACLAK